MIVVAGMHRSGTSCVTELLGELGVPLAIGKGLLEGDEWNERGYFEERSVLDLNSRLVTGQPYLKSGPRRWLALAAYATLPGRSTILRRAERLAPQIAELSAQRAGHVVKDPRFCVTLPAWQRHGQLDACVVCLREPLEIALSLTRRQRVPLRLGLGFWRYHMQALLEAVPERTLFVSYNELFRPGAFEVLERMRSFFELKLDDDELVAAHEKVCAPELSHCQAPPEATLPAADQSLWDQLRELAASSPNPTRSATK